MWREKKVPKFKKKKKKCHGNVGQCATGNPVHVRTEFRRGMGASSVQDPAWN